MVPALFVVWVWLIPSGSSFHWPLRLWWLVVVGVVCENCIVDASILFFVCVCFVLCVGLFVCVFVVLGRMVDALAC